MGVSLLAIEQDFDVGRIHLTNHHDGLDAGAFCTFVKVSRFVQLIPLVLKIKTQFTLPVDNRAWQTVGSLLLTCDNNERSI